jgi:hypothetical protein
MKIKKITFLFLILTAVTFFSPSFSFSQESDSGINSGDHGLHLRGALGAGQIFWGYISHGSNSGDLGTGAGGNINLSAMYNYSLIGLEFNLLSGNINDLEWTDKDVSQVEHKYKSTGSGNYIVYDWKLGAKLFTETGDMGYTFFYVGKRFWNSERKQDTVEMDGVSVISEGKREAKGDGWIYGFRDFSTIGMDEGFAIVVQSGFFFGKAPVTKMSTDGVVQPYPEKESVSFGGELGAGVAFQNIGLSVIGGLRGEINASTIDDPTVPAGEDSIFGFGNAVFFVEAGMMF